MFRYSAASSRLAFPCHLLTIPRSFQVLYDFRTEKPNGGRHSKTLVQLINPRIEVNE
ncbi:unnamed protein product [Nesidiocoris tenuis]|uniref:Uncharacterized protein n=1 Tax=Nesidiocoris tenuis TaxID=355587 RepID=A0A6H5G6A6_9HEMI|nr:unnamed protein product [Nesidiocoris tenuis]